MAGLAGFVSACRWAAAAAEANIEVEQVPAGTGTSLPSRSSAPPVVPRTRWPDSQRSKLLEDTFVPEVVAAELGRLVSTPVGLPVVASSPSAAESVEEYTPAPAGPAFALIVRSLVGGTVDDMERFVAASR